MRILITNDDGINAPGLKVITEIAQTIAGKDGEVWTVAPAFEQSGVGHCISYVHPTLIAELGPRRFAAEGTPADCVLAALGEIMPDRPDLILSGVNRGNNSGENTVYSGTIGAAMEGALQGIKAIALSQFYGPENRDLDDPFEAARIHGADLIQQILDAGFADDGKYLTFYNINFPPVPADAVKGTKAVSQGRRPEQYFGTTSNASPSGRKFMWVKGGKQDVPSGEGTDVTANLDGYISVTPMNCDLTQYDQLKNLQEQLK